MHLLSWDFDQTSGIDEPIKSEIQDVEKKISQIKSISRPTETTINTINLANTAMSHVDTIDSLYLQPLNIFSTFVSTIANVCLLLADNTYIVWWLHSDPSICSDGVDCIDCGLQGIHMSFWRDIRLTRSGIDHPISGKPRCIHCGSGSQNRKDIRAHLGTQVSIEDRLHEGRTGTNCPSGARMCAVHIELLQDQELLYVVTCITDSL